MLRRTASLLLAFLLTVAIQLVWIVAVDWAEGLRARLWPSEAPAHSESFRVLGDGTVAVYRSPILPTSGEAEYRSLDGKQIPRKDIHFDLDPVAKELVSPPTSHFATRPLLWFERVHFVHVDRNDATEYWFAVSDANGNTHLEGFDPQSNRRIGYLGRHGFLDTLPPGDDRFPLTPTFIRHSRGFAGHSAEEVGSRRRQTADDLLLILPNEVVRIDLATRRVVPIWDGAAIDAAWLERPNANETGSRMKNVVRFDVAAIRTPTRLHLVGSDRKERLAVEIPESFRTRPFDVRRVADRSLMLLSNDLFRQMGHVAWLSSDGPPKTVDVALGESRRGGYDVDWRLRGLMSPDAAGLLAMRLTTDRLGYDRDGEMQALRGDGLVPSAATLAVVVALSAALAVAAWRRQRRYALGGEFAWGAFVLLFGVPGWLAYRWHRAWPPLTACPACGESVPCDRDRCCRCGAPFPPPSRAAYEIREAGAVSAEAARSERS